MKKIRGSKTADKSSAVLSDAREESRKREREE